MALPRERGPVGALLVMLAVVLAGCVMVLMRDRGRDAAADARPAAAVQLAATAVPAPCSQAPVAPVAGTHDGALKPAAGTAAPALILQGQRLARQGRARDAELAFQQACVAAAQAPGAGLEVAEVQYLLGRHYMALATPAEGAPPRTQVRDALLGRAQALLEDSRRQFVAQLGDAHAKSQLAATAQAVAGMELAEVRAAQAGAGAQAAPVPPPDQVAQAAPVPTTAPQPLAAPAPAPAPAQPQVAAPPQAPAPRDEAARTAAAAQPPQQQQRASAAPVAPPASPAPAPARVTVVVTEPGVPQPQASPPARQPDPQPAPQQRQAAPAPQAAERVASVPERLPLPATPPSVRRQEAERPAAAAPVRQATGEPRVEQAGDAGPVPRPSFDCARARSQPERLICSDAHLAQLDRELGALHARARQAAPNEADFNRRSSQEWARREANCQDRLCLLAWFAQRRQQLLDELRADQGAQARQR